MFAGLAKGVHYYFRVFCRKRAGDPLASAVVQDQAIQLPTVPLFFMV